MHNTCNDKITDILIETATVIDIISGEGEIGTVTRYDGKRTGRAVRSRLARERCNGDRWAILVLDGQRV